jgi:peptidoglycan/LPS O-acetylase OafA/YrhL
VGALLTHDYQRTGWQTQTYGMSALAAAFALLVLTGALNRDTRPSWAARLLCLAPLRSAGKYSYAMYIFHVPIHRWLGARLIGSGASAPGVWTAVAYGLGVTLASYLAAWASYHLYEKHFLRLKRYFSPARAQLAEAEAV